MSERIIPAIMSGGAGTRLWPLSTEDKPKQFHALVGGASLFSETLRRFRGATALDFTDPIILCNARHRDLISTELAGARAGAIVLEPVGRNTAAAAVIAAALAQELDPDALVLLVPADHIVADTPAYHAAIARAAPIARERIVTFGITPDRPATGYGYIKCGAELAPGVFAIENFREKPLPETARGYLAEGGYCWNAGMFLFRPSTLLDEFSLHVEIRDTALEALANATRDGPFIHLDAAIFARTPSVSLDIAIMEKTPRAAVAPCEIGWADIGAWDEIWRLAAKDGAGNAATGPVAVLGGGNNLIRSEGVKVCIAGVSDLVVIATGDAVLIVPRAQAQDVKTLHDLALNLRT